jgi:hypothetical protein
MKEVLRTTNPVDLSYAQAVLKDACIEPIVLDSHMSVLEGSLGILPRRLMVVDDDEIQAKRLLNEASLAADGD